MFKILSLRLKTTRVTGCNTQYGVWRQLEYQNRHWDTNHWRDEILEARRKYGETNRIYRMNMTVFWDVAMTYGPDDGGSKHL
jgi:hypothetical protein